MFEGLRSEIEGLVVPAHGDAIIDARRLLDALTARVAEAESGYAAAGGWDVDGFGSMAAFLRHRSKLTDQESRRVAKRAARLHVWSHLAVAWRSGVVNGAQVDAAVAIIPDRHVDRFAEAADAAAQIIASLDALSTRVVLRHWVRRADAAADREAAEAGEGPEFPGAPERELFVSRIIDGVSVGSWLLDPDSSAVVEKALTAAARPDCAGERRSPAARRADALVEVARGYLAHLSDPDGNRNRERLTIVADITTLYRAALRGSGVRSASELEEFLAARPELGSLERGLFLEAFDGRVEVARTLDGNPVSDGLLSTVSSGGMLERLLTAGSRIIDHGRNVRVFTPSQRRAVLARDQGCRVAGCDAGPERCDVHHVDPWEFGGPSDLGNAVAKCRHEHLRHHRECWTEHLEPDGTYTAIAPDGTRLTTGPPGLSHPPGIPVHSSARTAPELPFVPDDDHLARDRALILKRFADLALGT